MRLLTHNFLQSNVKGTTKGYPLKIEATNVFVEESPMDVGLVTRLLPKLNYPALISAVNEIRNSNTVDPSSIKEIPSELPSRGVVDEEEGGNDDVTSNGKNGRNDTQSMSDSNLEALHQVLFNIHVIEGFLICPDTGRRFPVKDGIPNMILHEDEI